MFQTRQRYINLRFYEYKKNYFASIYLHFFIGCKSERPDTIIVYYLHGFVDTNISKECSVMREMAMKDKHSELVKYDTICIAHSDFVKLRDYISSTKVVRDTTIGVPGIDSRIVAVYDTFAVSFETTYNKYGANARNEIVYANSEIIYLLKSLSGYYNYFDKKDLLLFFPEIKKYGIPKTHKNVWSSVSNNAGVMDRRRNLKFHSKIILVDSI